MFLSNRRGFTSLSTSFITRIVGASLLVTIVAALGAIGVSYSMARNQIRQEFGQMRQLVGDSLAKSAWAVNMELLQAQADGIVGQKHISFIRIELIGIATPLTAGAIPSRIVDELEFALIYASDDRTVHLGNVRIVAGPEDMNAQVWHLLTFFVVMQSVGVVLVSVLIASSFRKKVAMPLESIARYASAMDLTTLHTPLSSARPESPRDELEVLTEAINTMRGKIREQMVERFQVEGRLRSSEESFRSLTENIPDIVARFGSDLRCIYVNPIIEEYTDLPREQLLGRKFDAPIWAGFAADLWGDHLQAVLDHGQADDFEMPGPDGICFHWRLTLEKSSLDQAGTVLAIARDITGRKRHEAELIELRDRAESANQSKSAFLANMSHEIRTPLNGILGMLQLLQTSSLSDEQRTFVDTAVFSTNRLTRLLSDILDLSRIESNKLQIYLADFSVAELIGSVQDIFTIDVRRKNLILTVDIDPGVPARLTGDEHRLRQILFNLVGNAVKFTNQGSVRLEVRPGQEPDQISFLVADTGIGIDATQLQGIFDPFTQVGTSLTREHQGAGLGLAIVKRLVDLMRGEIHVSSQPGEGTNFEIRLSLPEASERNLPHEPIAAHVEDAHLSVLLVEDDAVNQMAAGSLLEKMGCRVMAAGDGAEAVHLLRTRDVDVILMDIQMPVMDGLEATRIIRNSPELGPKSGVPIIALTAYAMAGDREKFLAAGIDDYLSKPVQLNTLRSVLQAAAKKGARKS